ncbi:MAG: hypothetical protein GY841_05400 [FCB group bacterium]|nr:hypothetical protein [FCB group bacterium]
MKESISSLEKKISGFLGILGPSNNDDSARIDLLDFDDLAETLSAAKAILLDADRLDRETNAVRQWFTGRIKAMRRGRRLMTRRSSTDSIKEMPEDKSLSELLRQYEHETAALRETAGMDNVPSTALSPYKRRAIKQYKS